MADTTFQFRVDATGGDEFTVVSFTGNEALSRLYRYEINLMAPTSVGVDLDDMLDSTARLVTVVDGAEYPVNGMLASFDENQTAQGYTYYTAVLVPRIWRTSVYRTNEIYTSEKTVDQIIATVLDSAGFANGFDYDSRGLTGTFLERDYVCQFRESDFDFLCRLMENEGIYFYFQQKPDTETMIIANGADYYPLFSSEVVFDAASSMAHREQTVHGWTCRKQRLPQSVTVRDYNPSQPSLDVAGRHDVDVRGNGIEYLYGDNFADEGEADYLAEIRAEEFNCRKTRFFGEGSVAGFIPGFVFELQNHPNERYNNQKYALLEVTHEASGLSDVAVGAGAEGARYQNSFVAIRADVQYRPPLVTPRPRFYGTMTAFVYSEAGSAMAEIDEQGRYRVHLPFDRAEGGKISTDPDRKSSHWIRMAQPYVGADEGTYFPLKGDTEVLLTFINGDPDRPIISGAVPNSSTPPLLTSATANAAAIHSPNVLSVKTGAHHVVRQARTDGYADNAHRSAGSAVAVDFINPTGSGSNLAGIASMLPPFDGLADRILVPRYNPDFSLTPDNPCTGSVDESSSTADVFNAEWTGGDSYGYANGRTFYYPQHERVYFIGTFHEDFHVRDNFLSTNSWTGITEQFNFPEPGGRFPLKGGVQTKGETHSDADVNPNGIRGVSEDKRWGDQLTYAYGRTFAWAGGTHLAHPTDSAKDGGSLGAYSYGNGYTENLLVASDGTSADLADPQKAHHDEYLEYTEFTDYLGETSVDKTYGRTYGYQNGFSLDVKVGDSASTTYGGTSTEKTYTSAGGLRKKTITDNEAGITTEYVYPLAFGALGEQAGWVGYSIENNQGSTVTSFSLSNALKASCEIENAAKATCQIENAIVAEVTMFNVGKVALNTTLAAVAEIEVTAGVNFKMEQGVGLLIEMTGVLGGKIECKSPGKLSYDVVGMKAEKKAAMEADARTMRLDKIEMDIYKASLKMESNAMGIHQLSMFVHQGVMVLGM